MAGGFKIYCFRQRIEVVWGGKSVNWAGVLPYIKTCFKIEIITIRGPAVCGDFDSMADSWFFEDYIVNSLLGAASEDVNIDLFDET